MKDLKIRVNNEAESKEAQELFFELGYKWFSGGNQAKHLKQSCSSSFGYLVAWSSGCFTDVIQCGCGNEDAKEITLSELRDLVVLKRNDGKWVFDHKKVLKPIEKKEMKEYLMPSDDYKSIKAYRKEGNDWIEVPEWAVAYADHKNGYRFFYDSLDKVAAFHDIVWQRAQHPEELPFIDDEPKYTDDEVKYMDENGQGRLQSINDKYVEIEQVRQNGLKLDNGKPRHSLLPKGSISSIIAVLEFGAKKYEANNWQKVDNAKERYYDAAMRHIDSWWNGEKFDQETEIHHLAHAATNLFFLKWFDGKDNNNE